ncbi:hypothetical protein ACDQ55_16370 [Chitinophaga sp. 30R24]|uniref:hypothetical protein n=1 Tax=Chitinophaga sp. 30R24 TaxID=3248838 RepID=UPI003B91D7BF
MSIQDKLLYVFYQDPKDEQTINEYIQEVNRLDELVGTQLIEDIHPGISNALYVHENRIHILPDWLDNRPGILFHSEIPFNRRYFLGTVFGMLGNEEQYPQYFTDFPAMLYAFDLIYAIIHAREADAALEQVLGRTNFNHPFENYIFNHNVGVALNYGKFSNEINAAAISAHYEDALQVAFESSYKAFTTKYYATFLTDSGNYTAAMQLIDQQVFKSLGEYPKFIIERVWCQAAVKQLQSSYDVALITQLKHRLWEALQFFDRHEHKIIAGLLWMDAATVATITSSYTESLGYINKSIQYFKEEKQPEMLAQAQIVRGRLFHDWAQSGNPQFFSSALEAYQEALSVFSKEDAPDVFAEIHHQLGVIYAALPDENKKRGIWAALSSSSFNEALAYYTKIDFPYEFGMICNNYANAFTKYPAGGKHDNFERALSYYGEALSIRSADTYPEERATTLLNYIEASWNAGNPEESFNWLRYNDMVEKVNEIKTLTKDEQLIQEANKHQQLLAELAKQIQTSVHQ